MELAPAVDPSKTSALHSLIRQGELNLAMLRLGASLAACEPGSPEHAEHLNDLGALWMVGQRPEIAVLYAEAATRAAPTVAVYARNLAAIEHAAQGQRGEEVQVKKEELGSGGLGSWTARILSTFQRTVPVRGTSVLELGGCIPVAAARNLGVKQWTCVDPRGSGTRESDYEVLQGRAEALPFEPETFDAAFSAAAFEHMGDLPGALSEAHRVLKRGGVLFTEFSPIWSCSQGHHVWVTGDDGLPRISFAQGAIPEWAHLIWNEAQLLAYLTPYLGTVDANRGVHSVHHSSHINRLFAEDYMRILVESGFIVEHLTAIRGPAPSPAVHELLRRRLPHHHDFLTTGFRLILRKG